jgi:hypothetical protein
MLISMLARWSLPVPALTALAAVAWLIPAMFGAVGQPGGRALRSSDAVAVALHRRRGGRAWYRRTTESVSIA